MSTETNAMTHQQAEAVFEELLRDSDGRRHLDDITRRAVRERETKIAIIAKYGDPRSTP